MNKALEHIHRIQGKLQTQAASATSFDSKYFLHMAASFGVLLTGALVLALGHQPNWTVLLALFLVTLEPLAFPKEKTFAAPYLYIRFSYRRFMRDITRLKCDVDYKHILQGRVQNLQQQITILASDEKRHILRYSFALALLLAGALTLSAGHQTNGAVLLALLLIATKPIVLSAKETISRLMKEKCETSPWLHSLLTKLCSNCSMEITKKYIKKLREGLQPKAAYAANHNMTPSHFFVSAILLCLMGGVIITAGHGLGWPLLLIPIILFGRLLCSNTAIIMMCEHKMTTHLNIFLAELQVAAADALIYLPFAFIEGVSGALVGIAVVMGILCEMVGVIAVPVINARRHDGPVDSTDRAFIFGSIALLLGVGIPSLYWVNIILVSLIVMEFVTIVNRIRKAVDAANR